jgi:hypothetical protein
LGNLLRSDEVRKDAGFRRFFSSRGVRDGITTSGRDCDENAAFLFLFLSRQISGELILIAIRLKDIKTTSSKTSP